MKGHLKKWTPLIFSFPCSSWLLLLQHLLLHWGTCYQLCFQTTLGPQKLHWSVPDQTVQKYLNSLKNNLSMSGRIPTKLLKVATSEE